MREYCIQGIILSFVYQCILLICVFLLLYSNNPLVNQDLLRQRFGAWDGNHYIFLSQHGYVNQGDQANFIAFYPLYPLLIHIFTRLLGSPYLSAIVITNIASVLGHAFFYVTLRELGISKNRSLRALLLLFVSPISIYFTHIYTEGLFLLLTSLFLFLLGRRQYFLAAMMGCLSASTRLVGATALIPYVFSFIDFFPKIRLASKKIFYATLIPIGFIVYLIINTLVWGSPTYYQKVMKQNWHKETVNPLTQYKKHLQGFLEFHPVDLPTYHLDIISTLMFPLLIICYLLIRHNTKEKEIPTSWIIWSVATYGIIASQSFWLSNMRYVFMILPLYPILERILWIWKPLYVITVILFFGLLFYAIQIFSNGGWLF